MPRLRTALLTHQDRETYNNDKGYGLCLHGGIKMAIEVKEQGTATARVRKLKESFHETSPALCPERVKFLVEAYQENEGKPPITIRAKAYEKFLKGMSLHIDENPIVGNLSKYRVGMVPYPEYS